MSRKGRYTRHMGITMKQGPHGNMLSCSKPLRMVSRCSSQSPNTSLCSLGGKTILHRPLKLRNISLKISATKISPGRSDSLQALAQQGDRFLQGTSSLVFTLVQFNLSVLKSDSESERRGNTWGIATDTVSQSPRW